MKYITFAIPCYNSMDYMNHAIDSLLIGGEDIEILVIDDGSSDKTYDIALKYQKKYPKIVKAIHKENGGHGSGVNYGLKNAKGLYYKVIDSDDWADSNSLIKILDNIKNFHKKKNLPDMIVSNYVYEKEGTNSREVRYNKILPENEIFTWSDIGKFKIGQYLLMHSVFYNTKFLKNTKLKLPEHTFYVDNIFVYYPLPLVKSIYYLDEPFYRYFIGREDQSVNESVMIKRVDQQLFVTKSMIDFFDPYDCYDNDKKLTKYLINYIDIMMSICTILLKLENTNDSKNKIRDIWGYLKNKNPRLYKRCCFRVSGLSRLPRFISIPGYKLARKIYKFN